MSNEDAESLANLLLDSIKNAQLDETQDYVNRGRRFEKYSIEALKDYHLSLLTDLLNSNDIIGPSNERRDIDSEFAIRGYNPEIPAEMRNRFIDMAKEASKRAQENHGAPAAIGRHIEQFLASLPSSTEKPPN